MGPAAVYEQLFNLGPYPCLVVEVTGEILAMNRPARERLERDEDGPLPNLFQVFVDPEGRLPGAVRRAAGTSEWQVSAAEIATGGPSGPRVQLSIRGLFDGARPLRPRVLVWLRDDALPSARGPD